MLNSGGSGGADEFGRVAIGCGRFADEPGGSVLNVRKQSSAIAGRFRKTFRKTGAMFRKCRTAECEHVVITPRHTFRL